MSETSYRFAPHPSSGFLLGLRIPQLVGFILAGALALAALRLGGAGRAGARAVACSRSPRACCWSPSAGARSSSGRR